MRSIRTGWKHQPRGKHEHTRRRDDMTSSRKSWLFRTPVLSAIAAVALLGWVANLGAEDQEGRSSAKASSGIEAGAEGVPTSRKKDGAGRHSTHNGKRGWEKDSQRTFLVTHVVDGDTIELGNGQTVRLVGIDTPEVGECGFEASSDALADLVLGREVTLTVSDEVQDQYGRLLRYVDVGTMDAGLRLIKRGLAVARYDSRDGYGYHPRERSYVDADAVSRDFGCPKPVPLVGATGGRSCAPGYSPCIPPYTPDIDCADVNGPIKVTGSDPHELDADGDGVACEP